MEKKKLNKNKAVNNTDSKEIIIDAQNKVLGRLASEVASFLMGKNSPSYERHVYSGFPVKVINASKVKVNNKKLTMDYKHKRYSGYPGGLRVLSGDYIVKNKGFGELLKLMVHRMLPNNKLRKKMMMSLEVVE